MNVKIIHSRYRNDCVGIFLGSCGICRPVVVRLPFFYVNPSDIWAWKIFPPSFDFFIFFLQNLWFLSCKFFNCLVRSTPRYFILFKAIGKDAVSIISLSVFLSFLYRKATNILELLLYPTTYSSYKSLLVEFSMSCKYTILSSYLQQITILCPLPFCFISSWINLVISLP